MSTDCARLPDGSEFVYADRTSTIQYWKDNGGHWWVYLPGCGAGRCDNHRATEHEDGTATFEPSILMHGHNQGEPTTVHGWIRRGKWVSS